MSDDLPNFRHLAAVAATVRHGKVTAAARAIHLTQPALTQAIARVEAMLDCVLFDRGASGMTPREPATMLAQRVDAALALIGSARVTGTQLRAFLAVARAGGFSSAAERTGLSSAALHRAVADLSITLGQRLLDKQGRRVRLTRAGERRARTFGLALAELRSGMAEVAAWQGRAAGRIVIGAMPLSRARWLPSALIAFRAENPHVAVSVVEGSFAEMVGLLRDGDIDCLLGALRAGAGHDDLFQVPQFEDRPQVIMRSGHSLAGTAPSIAALRRFAWILPTPDTPLRQYWQAMMRADGGDAPAVDFECGSVLTARELLLRSDALTLLSPAQMRVELETGILTFVAPPRPVARTIGVIHRTDWRPTAPQASLLRILDEQARLLS